MKTYFSQILKAHFKDLLLKINNLNLIVDDKLIIREIINNILYIIHKNIIKDIIKLNYAEIYNLLSTYEKYLSLYHDSLFNHEKDNINQELNLFKKINIDVQNNSYKYFKNKLINKYSRQYNNLTSIINYFDNNFNIFLYAVLIEIYNYNIEYRNNKFNLI